MNKHRMTAMVAAVVFAGFTLALAAEEKLDTAPADNTSQPITSEQKPLDGNPGIGGNHPGTGVGTIQRQVAE